MGGEEFAIVLPDIAPVDASVMAERLREACASLELTLDTGRTIRVTTSIGLVCAPGSGAMLQDLLRRADDALYAAKRDGRNRVIRAEPVAA